MNTPIVDFINSYREKQMARFHMPGHKGKAFLGVEDMDITEICGADSLYEADGIIAESEKNATALFGSYRTFYSTEGSSQCIRAMLYLILQNRGSATRPLILAARNVHKAFVYAAALLDFEVQWIMPESTSSLCSCKITAKMLEEALSKMSEAPAAVYITSPDYLGGVADIKALAEVCHKHGTVLAVDNAHGAYLHFVGEGAHPLDLGADICCDSAHKTLPVLTGGAYLHIGKSLGEEYAKGAKAALALFGSTSPSYLTLASLDTCNKYLADGYRESLADYIIKVEKTKAALGMPVADTEPLKITLECGADLADKLRENGIECEYADPDYTVLMLTPENDESELSRLLEAVKCIKPDAKAKAELSLPDIKKRLSIREAFFAKSESVGIADAIGRICGAPAVSCPPAIPVAVAGEEITRDIAEIFRYYGITSVEVVK